MSFFNSFDAGDAGILYFLQAMTLLIGPQTPDDKILMNYKFLTSKLYIYEQEQLKIEKNQFVPTRQLIINTGIYAKSSS